MFRKFANAAVLEFKQAPSKIASREEFSRLADFSFNDYLTDDGYLYVRVRAISSRVNKNHDSWPAAELAEAYRTFIGKPVFVDHNNHDPKRARGVVVDSQLHIEDAKTSAMDPYYSSRDVDPVHLPGTWVELLLEVDARAFPKLAKSIISGDIDSVSMGADVGHTICNICSNKAKSPDQFCKHVISKGAYFDSYKADGTKTSKQAAEHCYKISFFEISFVFDPADETALLTGEPKMAKRKFDFNNKPEFKKLAMGASAFDDAPDNPYGDFPIESPGDAIATGQDGWGELATGPTRPGEEEQVFQWRLKQFLNLGFDAQTAQDLAASKSDWHDFERVMGQGSTQDQAQRIFAAEQVKKCTKCGGTSYDKNGACTACGTRNDFENPQTGGDKDWFKGARRVARKTACLCDGVEGTGCPECGPVKTAQNDEPQAEMTKMPQAVDTLRQEKVCPVCGSDMEDGECELCGYIEPPEGFDNPDLEAAKEVDQDQDPEQPPPPGGPQNELMDASNQIAPPGGPSGQNFQAKTAGGIDTATLDDMFHIGDHVEVPDGYGKGSINFIEGNSFSVILVGGEQLYFEEDDPQRNQVQVISRLASRLANYIPVDVTTGADGSITVMSRTATNKVVRKRQRVNTQERPLLPATRQNSDQPKAVRRLQDPTRPVQSKTREDDMAKPNVRLADGASPQGEGVAAENRVDVLGVGGVGGDPLTGIQHENVEKDTGDFTAPNTDTWSGDSGDSLGQQDAVTNEVFKGAGDHASSVRTACDNLDCGDCDDCKAKKASKYIIADASGDLGGPIGQPVGDGGSASGGAEPNDGSAAGFPATPRPSRVDLNAGLAEEVGDNTRTWSDSSGQTSPTTPGGGNGNELGGPIGVAVSSFGFAVKAMQLAETEAGLGLCQNKWARVAELENKSEEYVNAQLEIVSRVKTAKVLSSRTRTSSTRLPSLSRFASAGAFNPEDHAVSDPDTEDSLY